VSCTAVILKRSDQVEPQVIPAAVSRHRIDDRRADAHMDEGVDTLRWHGTDTAVLVAFRERLFPDGCLC